MIYPSMQSINTLGAAKGSFNIAVDGFEAAYAAGLLSEFSLNICKADKLLHNDNTQNDRSTEYIEEACRPTDEKYFIDPLRDRRKCAYASHRFAKRACSAPFAG